MVEAISFSILSRPRMANRFQFMCCLEHRSKNDIEVMPHQGLKDELAIDWRCLPWAWK